MIESFLLVNMAPLIDKFRLFCGREKVFWFD